eukprot:TRINITY_DN41409_c0_g1_i1.p1 TRINITY_DN41409_c0_g1~~TRINITY_DN41409_c0_g1_i1.p1  ORF type:complete len:346 (+),score=36.96 TRINITY_DN41409_c0_g1_i1:49-1086(+)
MRARLANKLLFPAPELPSYDHQSFKGELLWVRRSYSNLVSWSGAATCRDDVDDTFPCRLMQAESGRYLIIYFHTMGDDLGSCRFFCERLRDALHAHVFIVEYPGYGLCAEVPPCSAGVIQHGFAALGFVQHALKWPLERTLLFGACLGVGPVMAIAAEVVVGGIVLTRPFLSLRKLMSSHTGPFSKLVAEQFPNESLAPRVKCSTLIVHGKADKVIPVSHAQKLFDGLSCRKKLVSHPDVSHRTCLTSDRELLMEPMRDFFKLDDSQGQHICISMPAWALQRHRAAQTPALASEDRPSSENAGCTSAGMTTQMMPQAERLVPLPEGKPATSCCPFISHLAYIFGG